MVIKELYLVDFGKFHEYRLNFDQGMNIVYGENEAGKSTLFHFIIGMFYGFYKPNIKNRRLSELHEKYKPWSASNYSGQLVFFDEELDKSFRIERDFHIASERVQIFEVETGEDVTPRYPLHPVLRQADIGKEHLGVSYTTFINTLGLKQLGHVTDSNLETELSESILNALSTRNIDVSLNQVHDKIDKKLVDIGSTRRKNSGYYSQKSKVDLLELELSEVIKVNHELKDLTQDIHLNRLQLDKAQIRLSDMDYHRDKEKLQQLDLLMTRTKAIQAQKEALENEVTQEPIEEEFSIEAIEEALDELDKQEVIKGNIKEKKESLKGIYKEVSLLKAEIKKPKVTIRKEDLNELDRDISESAMIETKLIRHEELRKDYDSEIHETYNLSQANKTKLSTCQRKIGIGFVIIIISVLAFILSKILWIESPLITTIVLLFSFVSGVILSGANIIWIKMYQTKDDDYNSKSQSLKEALSKSSEEEGQLKTLQKTLVERYAADDLDELKVIREQWFSDYMNGLSLNKFFESQQKQVYKLEEKQDVYEKEIVNLKNELQVLSHNTLPITSFYYIESKQELKDILVKLKEQQKFKEELKNINIRLKDILKDRSFYRIEEDFNRLKDKLEKSIIPRDSGTSFDEDIMEELRQEIEELQVSLASMQGKKEVLLGDSRSRTDILEDLDFQKDKLQKMDLEKQVYNKVQDTLNTITDELRHQFAPTLNESVTNIVSQVTGNKYQEVKISPSMIMRLIDPASHKTIDATKLSRGTLDLFYIALRQGLATWMSQGHQLPIIFDEPFSQLDNQRLEKLLELYCSMKQQVIFFTCQERELKLVNDLDLCHIIKL